MDLQDVVRLVTAIAFVTVGIAAARIHVRMRTRGSRWLLIAFGGMGVALALGRLFPDEMPTGLAYARLAVVAGPVVFFPYALFRFTDAFRPAPAWLRTGALAAAVTALVGLPVLAGPGTDPTDRTATEQGYLLFFLVYWTVLAATAVIPLWRASFRQPTVARRRLRVLAIAAAVLTVALIAAVGDNTQLSVFLVTQFLAITSSIFFLLGFAPPGAVRREWRAADERGLRDAERGLLSATDLGEVAEALLPPLARVFGGEAALVDPDGRPVVASDALPVRDGVVDLVRPAPGEITVDEEVLVLGLEEGSLIVRANPFTPFFGTEEISLLRSAGASLDLALSRVRLQEMERQATRRVEETNAELGALLYGISHDLRAPLVALTGYVELLTDPSAAPEERAFVLERISANTSYMDALIRDLLDLSRVGRVEERYEHVDLGTLVEELAAEARLQHPGAQVVVRPLPAVDMSRVRARQVLGNLIANALRHGGRDDLTITVSAHETEDGVVVSVSDDGVGIAPEHRARIFGIFERLQGRDERSGGTGIGLAMCRKIVEQIGGSIWVDDAVQGTDVRFLVPAERVRTAPQRSLEMNP